MKIRQAFKMHLKKGCEAEYKKRHSELWPEMKKILKESGVSDYSIFLDEETGNLFAYQLCEDGCTSQDMGENEIVKKWWHFMADIMDTNEDESPVSIPLQEMFHLD